ncbi:hypothetical protein ACKWMY_27185, partial [Serratia sp. J2]|uniref:hypothetical protein n=1 Tax=Serratia sp. J2 TaxID=3386551 RepID=UPI0039170A8F
RVSVCRVIGGFISYYRVIGHVYNPIIQWPADLVNTVIGKNFLPTLPIFTKFLSYENVSSIFIGSMCISLAATVTFCVSIIVSGCMFRMIDDLFFKYTLGVEGATS